MKFLKTDNLSYAIVEETDDIDGDLITDRNKEQFKIKYSETNGEPFTIYKGQAFILTSKLMIDSEA